MTVSTMEILGHDGEFFPLFSNERTRDALATYCELRWPVGRRKSVAREWGLSADEARSVCEGSASAGTLDKVWRHKNGGWTVLLPVMGAVIGQSVEQHLQDRRRKSLENASRLRAMARDLRPVSAAASGSDPVPGRGRPRPGRRHG